MSKTKGSAKTGGRSAGTPNKRTVTRKETIKAKLEMIEIELGLKPGELDPIEGLARIAGQKNTPLDVRVDCLKNIAPYVYPKLATVAVKGDKDDSTPINVRVNVDDFMKDPQLLEAAQRVALAATEAGRIEPTDDEGAGFESEEYERQED